MCMKGLLMFKFFSFVCAFLGSSWCTPHSLKELLLLPSRILQLTNIRLDDLSSDSRFGINIFVFFLSHFSHYMRNFSMRTVYGVVICTRTQIESQ